MAYLLAFAVSLILLFLLSFPMTTTSQDFSSANPTIADCTPDFLPLTPCAPFAQGMVLSPVQSCCDNIQQLYNLQPQCLCLLLNDTTLSSFPINTTLALQLPILCNLQIDAFDCPGFLVPVPPTPPNSQVSHGANSSSITAAASPSAASAPRSSIGGLGFSSSIGLTLKPIGSVAAVLATCALILLVAS